VRYNGMGALTMLIRGFGQLSAVVSLLLMVTGCSGAGRPPLGKVSGKVTYNGKSVTAGSVIFTPVQGSQSEASRIATGQIEADGSYFLTTFDTGDGAVLGQHVVTVDSRGDPDEMKKLNMKPGGIIAYKLPKASIPEKYTKPDRSPFKYTVEVGNNTINLELKD
jgi:hypothetical protein